MKSEILSTLLNNNELDAVSEIKFSIETSIIIIF